MSAERQARPRAMLWAVHIAHRSWHVFGCVGAPCAACCNVASTCPGQGSTLKQSEALLGSCAAGWMA